MSALLEVRNLVKNYKKVKAVQGVSFSVQQGKCFGLLGPNGAGKTTTIEVIENVFPPTSGEILYKGAPRSATFHEEVGIQFQQTSLLQFLTVRETLQTFKSMYKRTADIESLAELCYLHDFLDQMNDKISGGQKQRFLLALALVNEPELLFLDEPSTGLDPQARRNLWDIVNRIKGEGKTIILTTHYMEEAQYLCDEVAIMDNGKIVVQGSPVELIKQHGGDVTVILPKSSFSNLKEMDNLNHRIIEDRIEILTDNTNRCLESLLSRNINLSDIIIQSQNLESVFLNLTGKKLRE
ncbi:ABC transporter ATP-binding protein [bacterium]|nr:ABC transporter ATP-binding protein [bacterium]